jgi:hypothetical protein
MKLQAQRFNYRLNPVVKLAEPPKAREWADNWPFDIPITEPNDMLDCRVVARVNQRVRAQRR